GPAPINSFLGLITSTTARATTNVSSSAAPRNQVPVANATVENLKIGVPVAPTLVGALVVRSNATGSCVAGKPVLTGGSQVTGLTLLGKSVTADGVLTVAGNVVNGLPL